MTPAKWKVADAVYVKHLKAEGIIVDVIARGRYRVAIGSIHLVCKEVELSAGSPKGKDPNEPKAYHRALVLSRRDPVPKELDIHGQTVDEATRAVESLIDRAVLAGTRELRIVHGLGSGKLQHAIHRYLSTCGAVRHFKISEWNPGVTVIYLA